MDNRLRFLYYCMTELWGHRGKAQPRDGAAGKRGTGMAGKTAMQREGVKRTEIK